MGLADVVKLPVFQEMLEQLTLATKIVPALNTFAAMQPLGCFNALLGAGFVAKRHWQSLYALVAQYYRRGRLPVPPKNASVRPVCTLHN